MTTSTEPVDATIIDARSSTKNAQGARDPEMHQTTKGNNYFFGMKAHIGVDLHTGLVHSMVGTAANVADVTQVDGLLHGEEELVLGDAGYQGVGKREEHQGRQVQWHIALRPSLRKTLSKTVQSLQNAYEHTKASLRAKVEHPFRVIKRQFGYHPGNWPANDGVQGAQSSALQWYDLASALPSQNLVSHLDFMRAQRYAPIPFGEISGPSVSARSRGRFPPQPAVDAGLPSGYPA